MVNLSFLEKFTKGDTKKMKRYINMYLSIAPDTFVKMEQNITEEDWDQLRINAHSLKPQSDYMGIPSLKSVLIQIEDRSNEGNAEVLRDLHQQALKLHNESDIKLKEFIDQPSA